MGYKLYYFNLRARAECARQLFALADQPYEDIRVAHEQWPAMKNTMPFGTLPCLEVDGEKLGQSMTINRFLARRFGFAGKTPMEEAKVDAVVDRLCEFMQTIMKFYMSLRGAIPDNKDQILTDIVLPARTTLFNVLSDILEKNPSGFLVGDSVTYADLLLSEHIFNLLEHDANYMKDFPLIQAHYSKVRAIPKLKKWIEKRPKTIY